MKRTLAIAALTVAAAGSPSLAQTARQPATTPTGPSTNLPESMRIQQRTERQYFNSAVAPNSTGTTTEAPALPVPPSSPDGLIRPRRAVSGSRSMKDKASARVKILMPMHRNQDRAPHTIR